MKLPYRKRAFIPDEKVENYLLSRIHEKGKYKAAFFENLGFNETNKDSFKEALLKIAYIEDVQSTRDIISNGILLGKSYAIIGKIIGINGTADIKTIWKILKNKRKPILVTVTM